jgi:hypothetical protein
LVGASVRSGSLPDAPMRLIFCLHLLEPLRSNERPKALVIAITKKRRDSAAVIVSLYAVLFAFLLSGCADMYYVDSNRTPEAPYNTYYGPDYYPYYPWDSYYGGAYY